MLTDTSQGEKLIVFDSILSRKGTDKGGKTLKREWKLSTNFRRNDEVCIFHDDLELFSLRLWENRDSEISGRFIILLDGMQMFARFRD